MKTKIRRKKMVHPNEPTLEELKTIERELFSASSTDENMAKLNAIQKQIARHEAEVAVEAPETT